MALRGAYVAGGQGEWNICRWDGVLFQTPPPYIAKGGNIYTNCANNIRFDNFPDIQEFFNVPSDLNLIRATMKRNCDYIKIIIQIFIRERERNCKLLRRGITRGNRPRFTPVTATESMVRAGIQITGKRGRSDTSRR